MAGQGETLVIGDAVNVAARLEQAADPGEVLLGPRTHALVRDVARDEPVEPLSLKGKAEPVQAYRLLELLPDVPAFTRPIEAPFVGRKDELETLTRTLALAVDELTPQLATIVGAPGIGKSRLARELIQLADACSRRALPVLRRGHHLLAAVRDRRADRRGPARARRRRRRRSWLLPGSPSRLEPPLRPPRPLRSPGDSGSCSRRSLANGR